MHGNARTVLRVTLWADWVLTAGCARGIPYFEERSSLGEKLQGLRLPQRDVPESLDSARRLLEDVFQYHRRTHFTSEYIPKVDSTTMYYGLESRAPFLDHTLWEFAAGQTPEIHF